MNDFVVYGENRPNPQTMFENERVRVIIAGLKPGQRIPVHPAAAVYQYLEGQDVMTVNEREYPVRQGAVIIMDEGAQRGLLAETQLVLAVRLA